MRVTRREFLKLAVASAAGAVIEANLPASAITLPIGKEGKTFYINNPNPSKEIVFHEDEHRRQIKEFTDKYGTVRGDLKFVEEYIRRGCELEKEAGYIPDIEKNHIVCRLERFLGRRGE